VAAFSLQPTLKALCAGISQGCRDPVHPLRTDRREQIVLAASCRALEEGMVELFPSEEHGDSIMCEDTATAKRSLVVRAVGCFAG
jgi:hypothetical protein